MYFLLVQYMHKKTGLKKKKAVKIYIKITAVRIFGEPGSEQDGGKEDFNFIRNALIFAKGNAHV